MMSTLYCPSAGPLYFNRGPAALQQILKEVQGWSAPVPGVLLQLPVCGNTIYARLPAFEALPPPVPPQGTIPGPHHHLSTAGSAESNPAGPSASERSTHPNISSSSGGQTASSVAESPAAPGSHPQDTEGSSNSGRFGMLSNFARHWGVSSSGSVAPAAAAPTASPSQHHTSLPSTGNLDGGTYSLRGNEQSRSPKVISLKPTIQPRDSRTFSEPSGRPPPSPHHNNNTPASPFQVFISSIIPRSFTPSAWVPGEWDASRCLHQPSCCPNATAPGMFRLAAPIGKRLSAIGSVVPARIEEFPAMH